MRGFSGKRLRMESSDASGAYATVTIMFDGATFHTERSERDGKVFIDNGRFSSGGPVPRFVRCGRWSPRLSGIRSRPLLRNA